MDFVLITFNSTGQYNGLYLNSETESYRTIFTMMFKPLQDVSPKHITISSNLYFSACRKRTNTIKTKLDLVHYISTF